MAVKQVYKRIKRGVKPQIENKVTIKDENKSLVDNINVEKKAAKKNNKEKENNMTTEQFEKMEGLVQDINVPKQVKVVKKDRGLIERTESSKIVLTEDNRQVLND